MVVRTPVAIAIVAAVALAGCRTGDDCADPVHAAGRASAEFNELFFEISAEAGSRNNDRHDRLVREAFAVIKRKKAIYEQNPSCFTAEAHAEVRGAYREYRQAVAEMD